MDAEKYAATVPNRSKKLSPLEDPVKLCDTSKRETLKTVEQCLGQQSRPRSDSAFHEIIESMERGRTASLPG